MLKHVLSAQHQLTAEHCWSVQPQQVKKAWRNSSVGCSATVKSHLVLVLSSRSKAVHPTVLADFC